MLRRELAEYLTKLTAARNTVEAKDAINNFDPKAATQLSGCGVRSSVVGNNRNSAPTPTPPPMPMELLAESLPENPGPSLQVVGTPIPAAEVKAIAVDTSGLSFGLGVFQGLGDATYPVISTDSGVLWRVDGPEFWYAAAQGPDAVGAVRALPPEGACFWGQGGNLVRVTLDGGADWWETDFEWGVYKVSADDGVIDVIALGPPNRDGTSAAFGYRSTDAGRSWHLQGQLPNVVP